MGFDLILGVSLFFLLCLAALAGYYHGKAAGYTEARKAYRR